MPYSVLFPVSTIATIICIVLYAKSLNGMKEGDSGGDTRVKTISATFWYATLTIISFVALESFARMLAVWAGYAK